MMTQSFFGLDSGSVVWMCVEEMTTCIDTFIVWNVSLER